VARPTPTTPFQEELYAALGPLTDGDENQGWALLTYCGAIASMFDQIEGYARDSDDGRPGWAILMDPDRCPSEALPWLAQFVGTTLTPGLSDADQRAQIKAEQAFKRGTPSAIAQALQPYLTGTRTVLIRERDGGAYNLTVLTYSSETPDSTKALNAILTQKPAGIILTYATVTGANYLVIRASYATYTDLRAAFVTYNGLRNNSPGT
jgi:hypothetical protein